MCMETPEVSNLCLQWPSGLFWGQSLLLHLKLAVLARQTCQQPWDPSVSVPASIRPHLAFHEDTKDLNSGFHACATGTLPTDASKICLLHFLHVNSERNWCQVSSKWNDTDKWGQWQLWEISWKIKNHDVSDKRRSFFLACKIVNSVM